MIHLRRPGRCARRPGRTLQNPIPGDPGVRRRAAAPPLAWEDEMSESTHASDSGLTLDIQPFGPTSSDLDRIAAELMRSESLREALGDSRHRLLSIAAVDPEDEGKSD